MRRRLSVIFFVCLFSSLLSAQTNGTLSVSVTTSSTGGSYAPRNILAIWIEDNSGKFVKTLLAYADKRKQHLNTWETSTTTAGSVYNSIDAITGATQSSHGTRVCSWNGTDYNKNAVADGPRPGYTLSELKAIDPWDATTTTMRATDIQPRVVYMMSEPNVKRAFGAS